MKRSLLKLVASIVLVVLISYYLFPIDNANAATFSGSNYPTYVFQNTDGEFDVILIGRISEIQCTIQ